MLLARVAAVMLVGLFSAAVAAGADAETVLIVTNDYPPYTIDAEHDGIGVVLELAVAAFQLQGIAVEIKFMPWKRCELMLDTGEAFAAAPYFQTDQRQQQYDFSAPIVRSCNRLFYHRERIAADFTWQHLEDLRNYRIGGILGYWYLPELAAAGLTVELVRSDLLNLTKLVSRRLDFIIVDQLTGKALLCEHFPEAQAKIGMLAKPHSVLPFRLMISRHYPQAESLRQRFNQGLQQLQQQSRYQQILDKYQIPPELAVP